MNRLSIPELEELQKIQNKIITEAQEEIEYIDRRLYDQRDYERYSDVFININTSGEMPCYDFFKIVYKSLPGKLKKAQNIRMNIRSAFKIFKDDFFKLGDNIFSVDNYGTVYNIDTFIIDKRDVSFLTIRNHSGKQQPTYEEDKEQFYKKLSINIDRYIKDHPEYFI